MCAYIQSHTFVATALLPRRGHAEARLPRIFCQGDCSARDSPATVKWTAALPRHVAKTISGFCARRIFAYDRSLLELFKLGRAGQNRKL